MSDENELNSMLGNEQAAIEALLRSVGLPESAIDHDSVMYQAGWAAAVDSETLRRDAAATTKTSARFWPALAMTFAATTAACLAVIVLPHLDSETAVAIGDPVGIETVAEQAAEQVNDDSQVVVHRRDAEDAKAKPNSFSGSLAPVVRNRFGVAKLFGVGVEQMMDRRNAQFEKHLAEAASPAGVGVVAESDDDWDLETSVPLTSGSAFSFSL